MASRSLDDLTPAAEAAAKLWLAACTAAGLDILVYCTYRSPEEQDQLYKIGRSLPGKIVTNARGGQSKHQSRTALDFVPLLAGKPHWNGAVLYLKAGELAETHGFEWAGRWTGSLHETAHIQLK